MRPSGLRKSHDFSAFVKCFTCGIINRLAKHFHVIVVLDEYYLRVPARDEQAEEWVFWHDIVLFLSDEMREDMSKKVVDIDDGNVQSER